MTLVRGTPEQRFWSKVQPEASGCWTWTAARSPRGYGRFGWAMNDVRMAHRVAWELLYGPIPPGLFACHSCDNPPCVRPSHIFIGSNQDNVNDKVSKGRQSRGETHGRHKLSEADARYIKSAVAFGVEQRALADQFGVSQAIVSLIVRGKKWTWLT